MENKEYKTFCFNNTLDFMGKYVFLIEYIKDSGKYPKKYFELLEANSESYSIDSVKWDFAILCSKFKIDNLLMIKYFNEFMILFKQNQVKDYEENLEHFLMTKIN